MHTIFLPETMERGNFRELDIQSISSISDLSKAMSQDLYHIHGFHMQYQFSHTERPLSAFSATRSFLLACERI